MNHKNYKLYLKGPILTYVIILELGQQYKMSFSPHYIKYKAKITKAFNSKNMNDSLC